MSDTPETDAAFAAWKARGQTETASVWSLAARMERERDAALRVIEQIEDRYIDGWDTYDDWRFMGQTARNFILIENTHVPTNHSKPSEPSRKCSITHSI